MWGKFTLRKSERKESLMIITSRGENPPILNPINIPLNTVPVISSIIKSPNPILLQEINQDNKPKTNLLSTSFGISL